MINKKLLQKAVQDLIFEDDTDLNKIAFSDSPFPGINVQELLSQVAGRRRMAKKLPTWTRCRQIVYPRQINLEQTSSESTARYKAGLIHGTSLIDITGGFGVDCYFLSDRFSKVTHCETDEELSEIAKHNFQVLGRSNIEAISGDGLQYLKQGSFEWVYADPARRHEKKGKVFYLSDCTPDIPANIEFILEKGSKLMLKTSPMLDISQGVRELGGATEVHIVAVKNEVKELLWIVDDDRSDAPKITAVNILEGDIQVTETPWEDVKEVGYSEPMGYLYEPNTSLMKSGAFCFIAGHFGLNKLHPNTHLYTSDRRIDFPGRMFKIDKVLPYSKREMKSKVEGLKANVSVRNFPETVKALRKKWKIRDGGTSYIFFVTIKQDQKVALICTKPIDK